MEVPDLDPLRDGLEARVTQLEEEYEEAEERTEGDGSTAAAWRVVEPKIRRRVVESCLSDLEKFDDLNDLLKVAAEWRRNVDWEWRFKRNNSSTKNNRNDIKRAEQEIWIDEILSLVPDSEFQTCGICGSDKLPESDRRRKLGFKWECAECGI